jgi:hypothetical protein
MTGSCRPLPLVLAPEGAALVRPSARVGIVRLCQDDPRLSEYGGIPLPPAPHPSDNQTERSQRSQTRLYRHCLGQ